MLRAVNQARINRQISHNLRLIEDFSRKILIKGGLPSPILQARKDIWKSAAHTDAYLALTAPYIDPDTNIALGENQPGNKKIHKKSKHSTNNNPFQETPHLTLFKVTPTSTVSKNRGGETAEPIIELAHLGEEEEPIEEGDT